MSGIECYAGAWQTATKHYKDNYLNVYGKGTKFLKEKAHSYWDELMIIVH